MSEEGQKPRAEVRWPSRCIISPIKLFCHGAKLDTHEVSGAGGSCRGRAEA